MMNESINRMKKTTLLLALILQNVLSAYSYPSSTVVTLGDSVEMSLSEIIALSLPVMDVETVNHEEPTCDYVSAPSGSMGASIANATKVPGRLVIYRWLDGKDSVIYDSGDYEKDVSGMTIKLRGNTSAYKPKKPYKIKLQKKFDLLFGGNDSVYKDKEWLLLCDDYLATMHGFEVSKLVGMQWTPRHHYVNVVINGRYIGAYLLCESVKRNPDCRLNVDKNTGYIFEFDPYWWNESLYVTSSHHPKYNYTFKYPDDEDITEDQLGYMQSLVKKYEKSLTNGTYNNYIDVRSFAAWCLVHDIMGTKDAGGANMFYCKYDTTAESKIVMPLAWDFDMAYRTAVYSWSASHIDHMTRLFNSTNRAFTGEFVAAWRSIRSTFISDATSYMTAFLESSDGEALNASFALDEFIYGRRTVVAEKVDDCNRWIKQRCLWLNAKIRTICPLGDVNVDSVVTIDDVTCLIQILLNGDTTKPYADVDENGVVDISDVTALINILLSN